MGINSRFRPVEPAHIERRRDERSLTVRRLNLRREGKPVLAMLLDLSPMGCRITSDSAYQSGERVMLQLAGDAAVAATVVWVRAGTMGCRFDQAIDRTLFRALTLRLC